MPPPEQKKGGRKKPEGVKVSFYMKEADAQKLQAMADEEHRNTIDNMAFALVKKGLGPTKGATTVT